MRKQWEVNEKPQKKLPTSGADYSAPITRYYKKKKKKKKKRKKESR